MFCSIVFNKINGLGLELKVTWYSNNNNDNDNDNNKYFCELD